MTAKKLLVADDSVTIQKVIRLALSNEGYEIQAVSDGGDALQQITLFRPDIVLIDVSLPNQNAFEVKRSLNQHQDLSHIRFVLMSSAFEKVDEVQASEVEFHARLTKPFDPAHLREILTQVLEQAPSPRSLRPTAPPPLPPMEIELRSEEPSSGEDDIRHLTESTIRISGLENYEKNEAYEPEPTPLPVYSGFSQPSLPPLPTMTAKSNSPFEEPSHHPQQQPPAQDDFGWSVQEPVLKPPRSIRNERIDTTFPLEGLSAYQPDPVSSRYAPEADIPSPESYRSSHLPPGAPPLPSFQKPSYSPAPSYTPEPHFNPAPSYAPAPPSPYASELPSALTPPYAPAPQPTLAEVMANSEKEIERIVNQMVTQKLEEALKRITQSVLPDVMEKVVKEEIHRLLSEKP